MTDKPKISYQTLPIDDIVGLINSKPVDEVFVLIEQKPPQGKTWRAQFYSLYIVKDGVYNVIKAAIADTFKVAKVFNDKNERGEFEPKVFTSKSECPKLIRLNEAIDSFVDNCIKTKKITPPKNTGYHRCVQTHYGDDIAIPVEYRGKEILNSSNEPDPRVKFGIDTSSKTIKTGKGDKSIPGTEIKVFENNQTTAATYQGQELTNENVDKVIVRGTEILMAEIEYGKLTISKFGVSVERTAKRLMILPTPESVKQVTAYDSLLQKKMQALSFGVTTTPAKVTAAPVTTTTKAAKEEDLYEDDDDEDDEEDDEEEEPKPAPPPPAKKTTAKGKKPNAKDALSGL